LGVDCKTIVRKTDKKNQVDPKIKFRKVKAKIVKIKLSLREMVKFAAAKILEIKIFLL
jgi:hypothetical protein